MTTRMIGARIPRNEDPRLLRGLGCFVDDVHLEGVLHAAGLRSPHGHARILSIDASRARALPGVHLVLTAADLGELNQPSPLLIPHPALTQPRTQRPLATDRVRYMGEMVAFVVAEDRYVAEDAAELIDVRYEPLPAVTELEAALAAGSPLVHADVPANRAGRLVQRVGDPDAAFARSARVLRERLWIERSCGCPIETRGVVAHFDPRAGTLRAWISTQAPLPIKNGLARIFGLPEFQVEVIAPDIGGAFGSKIMLFYPEEILVPCAAMRLGRPVKWIEDRVEHLQSTSQERGQLHDVEVAIDEDGRILGLRNRFLHDAGAYTPYGLVVPLITSTQLPGPYRLRNYSVEFDVVYTNKVQVTPYRGAGRPHGAFVMERVIGLIARDLGIEPVEVRRRNLIQPDEFPWDVGLTFQDGGPTRYDSGNYPAGLDMALSMIGYGDFRARLPVSPRGELGLLSTKLNETSEKLEFMLDRLETEHAELEKLERRLTPEDFRSVDDLGKLPLLERPTVRASIDAGTVVASLAIRILGRKLLELLAVAIEHHRHEHRHRLNLLVVVGASLGRAASCVVVKMQRWRSPM